MASITEQVLARALVVLTGTTAAGSRVERSRADAVARDALPCLCLRRIGTTHQDSTFESDQVTTSFDLVVDVSAADQAAGETAADALHLAAHALLMADVSLSFLGHRTLRCIGTDCNGDGADADYTRLVAHYEIDAWIHQADLTTPA